MSNIAVFPFSSFSEEFFFIFPLDQFKYFRPKDYTFQVWFYSVQHLTIRRLKCAKNVYEWGKTKDKLQVIAKLIRLLVKQAKNKNALNANLYVH